MPGEMRARMFWMAFFAVSCRAVAVVPPDTVSTAGAGEPGVRRLAVT